MVNFLKGWRFYGDYMPRKAGPALFTVQPVPERLKQHPWQGFDEALQRLPALLHKSVAIAPEASGAALPRLKQRSGIVTQNRTTKP
jgi:hypothetical protein